MENRKTGCINVLLFLFGIKFKTVESLEKMITILLLNQLLLSLLSVLKSEFWLSFMFNFSAYLKNYASYLLLSKSKPAMSKMSSSEGTLFNLNSFFPERLSSLSIFLILASYFIANTFATLLISSLNTLIIRF